MTAKKTTQKMKYSITGEIGLSGGVDLEEALAHLKESIEKLRAVASAKCIVSLPFIAEYEIDP